MRARTDWSQLSLHESTKAALELCVDRVRAVKRVHLYADGSLDQPASDKAAWAIWIIYEGEDGDFSCGGFLEAGFATA
jgi:hypothetical protein